jgi:hypothetical protein
VRLDRDGLAVKLPPGFSGRLFARASGGVTLHAASFALSLDDGEFGDASTGLMPPGGAFAALTEYGVDHRLAPGSGLFAARRIPVPLDPAAFSRRRLAHPRPGQAGAQHFFTAAGRPFCLYVVIASPAGARRAAAGRHPQLPALNRLLGSVSIGPQAGG